MLKLYIGNHDSRWIEKCQDLILDRWSCWGAIERCPQQSDLDGSRSNPIAIKETLTFLMDREAIETNSQNFRWIEIAIIAIEKGRSKGSINSLAVERYWEAVEIAQK